jgi:Ran-binding protein 1
MKLRVKLFRWRDEQWKERGIGNGKLMRDREQKRIRFVMRQEKTLKPVANFYGKYIERAGSKLTIMS